MSESQKTIGLVRPEQIRAYQNARIAAKDELDGDVTEGEIVRELARAYTGWEG